MGWAAKVQAWLIPKRDRDAADAIAAADKSHARAVGQRDAMTKLRVEADEVRAQVRAHNEANRFDDFLASVIRGRH
jgi:hypothetical protein